MKIKINGKDVKYSDKLSGNNIVITGNNNVVVNGKTIFNLNDLSEKQIKIEITGDVKKLETANGDIKIFGNVDKVETVNGDVEVEGNVNKVKAINGDIAYNKK